MSERNQGFFAAHLDPGAIFGEILFGLIMVLTFTLGAGVVVEEGPGAFRALLAAALGCNLAWGLIDGAMYLMGSLLDRGRRNRMLLALKSVQDEEAALRAIGGVEGALARHADGVVDRARVDGRPVRRPRRSGRRRIRHMAGISGGDRPRPGGRAHSRVRAAVAGRLGPSADIRADWRQDVPGGVMHQSGRRRLAAAAVASGRVRRLVVVGYSGRLADLDRRSACRRARETQVLQGRSNRGVIRASGNRSGGGRPWRG